MNIKFQTFGRIYTLHSHVLLQLSIKHTCLDCAWRALLVLHHERPVKTLKKDR